jgi:hypothetical protein
VAAATLVHTIVLYIIIPKGFFPTQDTGEIQGTSQAPATIVKSPRHVSNTIENPVTKICPLGGPHRKPTSDALSIVYL